MCDALAKYKVKVLRKSLRTQFCCRSTHTSRSQSAASSLGFIVGAFYVRVRMRYMQYVIHTLDTHESSARSKYNIEHLYYAHFCSVCCMLLLSSKSGTFRRPVHVLAACICLCVTTYTHTHTHARSPNSLTTPAVATIIS